MPKTTRVASRPPNPTSEADKVSLRGLELTWVWSMRLGFRGLGLHSWFIE